MNTYVESLTPETVSHGDWVAAWFDPPLEDEQGQIAQAQGEIMRIVGQTFLAASSHKNGFGMPTVLRLDDHPGVHIELIETSDEAHVRKQEAARGEVVFETAPRTTSERIAQLDTLAEMIQTAPDKGFRSRKSQLRRQFDDIADQISLAQRKRKYILTRARLGRDFHPWTDRDERIFRIETVRPLPADFEIDPVKRKDRERRFTEAVAIFGEAEREVRILASRLRAMGYVVRRPHPNAQALLLRIALGDSRQHYDIALTVSANGLWEISVPLAENKGKNRLRQRLTRSRDFPVMEAQIQGLLSDLFGM